MQKILIAMIASILCSVALGGIYKATGGVRQFEKGNPCAQDYAWFIEQANKKACHHIEFMKDGSKYEYFQAWAQVSGQNHDPIIARFVDGAGKICEKSETSGDDTSATGCIIDTDRWIMYCGSKQGGNQPGDFRTWSNGAWIQSWFGSSSFGIAQKSNVKTCVLYEVDPDTLLTKKATFLGAIYSKGDPAPCTIVDMWFSGSDSINVLANARWGPLFHVPSPPKPLVIAQNYRFNCNSCGDIAYQLAFPLDLTKPTEICAFEEQVAGVDYGEEGDDMQTLCACDLEGKMINGEPAEPQVCPNRKLTIEPVPGCTGECYTKGINKIQQGDSPGNQTSTTVSPSDSSPRENLNSASFKISLCMSSLLLVVAWFVLE